MTCHFAFIKIFFGFFIVFVGGAIQSLIVIPDKPSTGIRYFLMRVTTNINSRIALFCSATCLWVFHDRKPFCYKKYLGPDWKPDYDILRTGSVICNHTAALDPLIFGLFMMPSHIAKGEAKDIPGMGTICTNSGCLFLDRSSKNSKEMIQQ